MLVWESQIRRDHDIEVFDMVRKPHSKKGWDYIRIHDIGLIALVKAKIRSLYERFFESPDIQLAIPVSPSLLVTAIPAVALHGAPAVRLIPSISIKTKVKIVE